MVLEYQKIISDHPNDFILNYHCLIREKEQKENGREREREGETDRQTETENMKIGKKEKDTF